MIRMDRDGKDKPSDKWLKKAGEETEAATRIILDGKRPEFKKDIYGDKKEIIENLRKIHYDKCAYCETRIVRDDFEVEHFRPKGRVFEDSAHPGYYWLAYEWNNLFLSCKWCNQLRVCADGKTRGKKDRFPVRKEENRARRAEDRIEREEPLLIDPGVEDPSVYLRFSLTGEALSIDDDNKGIISIEVFNLNDERLVENRLRLIEKLKFFWLLVKRLEDNAQKEYKERLIDSYSHPSSEYSALAIQFFGNPENFIGDA